jgi:Rrf2 family protein
MKLSVKVDYACRVLAQLGRMYDTDELAHIEDLARIEGVPANYLVQILSELRNGGLISSRRGKQGGYALARPPEGITLWEIVRLIEGEVLELSGPGQGRSAARVHQVWGEVKAALEDKCRAYSLADLMTGGADEMYYI